MTTRDYAILKLLEEAINARNAEALVELWRRFADWHGLHPDLAVVLQEREGQESAGFSVEQRVQVLIAERTSKKSVH